MFRIDEISLWKNIWMAWVVVIIIATTAPWTNFQPNPTNWHRINWVPYAHIFMGYKILTWDIVQNLVLYMPFGYSLAKSLLTPSRSLLFFVGVLACTLSFVTEVAQVFQPARFPSATDVVNNIWGALVGAVLGRWCDITRESRLPFTIKK